MNMIKRMNGIAMMGALLICGAPISLMADSGGTPAGYTGAPDEQACQVCHGRGTPLNSGPGRIAISVVNATGYTPGRPLRLRITLEDVYAVKWGFQMTSRRTGAGPVVAGTFSPIADQGTSAKPSDANPTYIGQSLTGTRLNQQNRVAWETDWNAPSDASGDIVFYAAGVAGNNLSGADSGDSVYTTQLTVRQGTEAVSGTRVLPQFVFGEGFISTLSFANMQTIPATVRVNFFNAEGAPMLVNGNSSRVITLPSKGSASIRADDTGPQTQGWALIDMPDGVTGHGVFRQRVQGRIDQEAVVMFSRTDSKLERFIYDQTAGFDTALVLLNTSYNA